MRGAVTTPRRAGFRAGEGRLVAANTVGADTVGAEAHRGDRARCVGRAVFHAEKVAAVVCRGRSWRLVIVGARRTVGWCPCSISQPHRNPRGFSNVVLRSHDVIFGAPAEATRRPSEVFIDHCQVVPCHPMLAENEFGVAGAFRKENEGNGETDDAKE